MLKSNKILESRLEQFKLKACVDFDTAIVVDAVETIYSKNIDNPSQFLTESFKLKNVEEYEKLKNSVIIRKKREISEEVKNARFEKQYQKLCEKYGRTN